MNKSTAARLRLARIKYDQHILRLCVNISLVVFLWLTTTYVAGHVLAAKLLGRLP